jgi:hypothetical protein
MRYQACACLELASYAALMSIVSNMRGQDRAVGEEPRTGSRTIPWVLVSGIGCTDQREASFTSQTEEAERSPEGARDSTAWRFTFDRVGMSGSGEVGAGSTSRKRTVSV